MNKYKKDRNKFFQKYFPYPTELEEAIRLSDPTVLALDASIVTVNRVRRVDNSKDLIRIMDNVDYRSDYYFSYDYCNGPIHDWACISWHKGDGLWLRFEWLNSDVATMNEKAWEFLFSRREIIFRNFYPNLLLKHTRREDLGVRIADSELNSPPRR